MATLLTQMLFLGIVAASLIFLSAYGGMVSLAQVSIYGVAGFALGNLTTNGNTKGLNLGWAEAPGIVVALVIAVIVALVFGALASRSYGIYFLMITLVFSVIANLFFGQVTSVSGFGGISGIPIPDFLSRTAHPDRLYFVTLAVALLVYALLRYVARTPFGLTLQGIRDDPVRMSSLGYNVTLHRTLAFAFAGFIAAIGGVLFVWWNAQIAPSTIGLSATIDVLVIAVIGGLYRLEGAWLGALVFVLINNYAQDVDLVSDRFHTLIGVIFLVIVLVSPNGLIGLWERVTAGAAAGAADGHHPGEGVGRTHTRRLTRYPFLGGDTVCLLHDIRAGGLSGSRSPSQYSHSSSRDADRDDNNEQQLGEHAGGTPSTSTPAAAAPTDAPDPQPAVAPRSGGSGTPIKIAIMSECKGAFGSFDNQNMAGAVAALSQFAGAKPKNPNKPQGRLHRRRHRRPPAQARRRGLRRRHVGHGHQGDAAAHGAARRRRHDRPAVRRRVDRGRQLRQAAPGQDVRRRLRGRAGHDAQGAGAELLPLQRRRRAVERRAG